MRYMSMPYIPDDIRDERDCDCDKCKDDWRVCCCQDCQDLRDEYADIKYQEMKDKEFDK